MSFRNAEYGAFQRSGGRVISSLTLSHVVAYAVSGTLVYLPLPRHRDLARRIQKDAGDELSLQLPLSGKNCCLLQMNEHASPQDHLAHCGTLEREK